MSEPERARKILVADDEVEIRRFLQDALSAGGFEAHAVGDGAEALREASKSLYDLIILDIEMPRLNGLEACRSLRELPLTQSTPILFLTALKDAPTIERAFSAGASDYLPKPVHPALLLSRVGNLLRLADQAGEIQRLRDALEAFHGSAPKP